MSIHPSGMSPHLLERLASQAGVLVFRYRLTEPAGLEWISQAAQAVTGFSSAEQLADPELAASCLDPDDLAVLVAAAQAGKERCSLRWLHVSGSQVCTDVELNPVIDRDSGQLLAVEALARLELTPPGEDSGARQFVRTSPLAICITAQPENYVVEVNPEFERLFGYTRAEMIGLDGADLPYWGKSEIRRRLIDRLQAGGNVHNEEIQIIRKDGRLIDCLISMEYMEYLGHRCLVGMISDASPIKAVERVLRESEETRRALINVPRDAIYLLALDGTILDLNQNAASYAGLPQDELIGQSFLRLPVGQRATHLIPVAFAQLREHKIAYIEEEDEQGRTISHTLYPVFDEQGQLTQIALYSLDISDRRQSEAELQSRERFLRVLNDITRSLLAPTGFEPIYHDVVSQLADFFNADGCYLNLWDTLNLEPVTLAGHGVGEETYKKISAMPGEPTLTASVLAHRRPLIVDDPDNSPYVSPRLNKAYGVHSALGLPLIVGETLLGSLLITHRQPHTFDEREISEAEHAAGQIAVALHQAHLLREQQRGLKELAMLHGVALAGVEAEDADELIRRATVLLGEVLPADNYGLLVLVEEGTHLVMHPSYVTTSPLQEADAGGLVSIDKGLTGRAVRTGQPVRVLDIKTTPDYLSYYAGIRSEMCVPLKVKGRVIGVINVESSREAAFLPADERLLITFSNQLATAMEKHRLSRLERQRVAELATLHQISTVLRTAHSQAEMLPVILDEVMKISGANSGLIAISDPHTRKLRLELGRGDWEGMHGEAPLPGPGLVGQVIAQNSLVMVSGGGAETGQFYPELSGASGCAAGVPLAADGMLIGALLVGSSRRFDDDALRLLASVANMAANAIHRTTLHEETERSKAVLEEAYDATIAGWSRALELRDGETEGHSKRVVDLTVRLAERLGITGEALKDIRRGALLHDIGKMGVPDHILLKAGPLDPDEWQAMRQHPEHAYDMLKDIPYLRPAAGLALAHHERWDGSGYPFGLRGEEIPLPARIFAIVDVWEALQEKRPYRMPWRRAQVLRYLEDQSGKQFDPAILNVFFDLVR